MAKNFVDKLSDSELFRLLLIVGAFFVFIMSGSSISLSNEWNGILIEISLGLLTFLAIFYTFVIKREVIQKREKILTKKWRDYLPEFMTNLGDLQKESKKDKADYQTMSDISRSISDKLENMTLFEIETDIRRYLLISVLGFIIGLLLFLIDSVTSWHGIEISGVLWNLRLIGYVLFWIATYHSLRLLLVWNKIVKTE